MAAAPVRVGGRFRFRRKTPAAIENRAYLAEYDAGRDELTVHTTSQVPGIIRNALAEALGMPGSRVHVIAPDVGGGFGGKTSLYPEELLVAFAARRLGAARQVVRRSPGGPDRDQPELRRDRRRGIGARRRRPHAGAGGRRDRRYRRLLDLSVDGGAGAGAGRQLPAGALSHPDLSRRGARRGDSEGADGAVSRRRPAGCRRSSWSG